MWNKLYRPGEHNRKQVVSYADCDSHEILLPKPAPITNYENAIRGHKHNIFHRSVGDENTSNRKERKNYLVNTWRH